MKYGDSIVFVVVAAAVLIAAYGVGLLVRQARTPTTGSLGQPQVVPGAAVDSNDATTLEGAGEPNEMRPAVPDTNEPVQKEAEPEDAPPDPNAGSKDEDDDPGLTTD